MVSQNLLNLVHAPEVQDEIGVNNQNRLTFENQLREIDRVWWPARVVEPSKQREVVAQLETKLMTKVESLLGKRALQRLREIEYQSQGVRMLARPELASYLGLSNDQQTLITKLFEETDKLAKEISPANVDPQKLEKLQQARVQENKSVLENLTIKQTQQVHALVGKTIDTAKLQRIYPLAPELVPGNQKYGEGVTELSKLRGQVVLIHFYAFQCHNCHANFKHYKRWSEELKDQGVQIIGIQTPETQPESDHKLVSSAATREGFNFPVIMDMEKQNWSNWGNTMWPTVYVVDKQGYIRYWWQGELNWNGATGDKKIEDLVQRLLQES